MIVFLRLALFIMNRLKFPQKFLLISFLFALPMGLTTFYFVHDINDQIDFAAKERVGIVAILDLSYLINHLQTLRGVTYHQEAETLYFAQESRRALRRIVLDIHDVDATNASVGKILETDAAWQAWKANWTLFQQDAPGLNQQQHFDRSTELITQIIGLISHIGDSSNLILDPDLDSYYLMEATVNRLPSVAEAIGVARGQYAVRRNAQNSFSEEKRLFQLGQAIKDLQAVRRGTNVVYKANPPLEAELEPQLRRMEAAFQNIMSFSVQSPGASTASETLARENRRLFTIYTVAMYRAFKEHALTSRILDLLLVRRMQGFETKRNRVMALTCITVVMVIYFLTGFYFSIRQMVHRLATTTNQLLKGEKSELVTLENRDEMAQVAALFNQVCHALQESSAQLQSNNANLEHIVEERTRQMEHQAYHDALTGLPNRLFFLKKLTMALQKTRLSADPIAVIFLDLDNFKTINDSLGHEAGDQMLRAIAQRLTDCIKPGDTVARLGGDEFTLLLEGVKSVEDAISVTERIIASLQNPITVVTTEIFASGSMGIAFTYDADCDADSLLRDADTAMYHAKGNGKSGYAVYAATMSEKVVERMQLESALRFALERNEFVVHYQPLVNLETGCLAGAEALVRWKHPHWGLLQPGKFLPIAEDTGLIVPIGYWVLEEACRQAKIWLDTYPSAPPFIINVNLSGRQLQREDVVQRVQAALEKTGLPPAQLKLEITESVMMIDVEKTVSRLHELKALGVKLAMDDFGTGYSSMASLNIFPLDTVKIDRSFVQRLGGHEQSASIVAAIISLARALNMDVTGEGIETEAHISYLQSMGCQIGQGYYFAKPMNSTSMTNRIITGESTPLQSMDKSSLELIERLLSAA